jgi:glycosyltransferase involved in cell wall biosynthesis
MVARELAEFFDGFSPSGMPVVQAGDAPAFLSNVNACYSRACWEELRFRDVGYAEDQAFGRDLLAAGWCKVYHPRASVVHAHDYGVGEFMRRYFDEYRGLREAIGHVEPFEVRGTVRYVLDAVGADRRWMREHGISGLERVRWTARAAVHHGGRKLFSALGSRADALPSAVQRSLSLEDRATDLRTSKLAPLGTGAHVDSKLERDAYDIVGEVWREGPTPLLEPRLGMADRDRLRIAMIIPPFGRGSGGHNTLVQILSRLERRGHVCTVWVHDYYGQLRDVWPGVLRRNIVESFAPIKGPVYKGFHDWRGADVVIATGWQTVHPALRLSACHARVYLVNDHEPEFYAASTERVLAADTYCHGLHCIAASPWLRDLLVERYRTTADAFQLGVDHANYTPRPVERQRDMVVCYARHETPRRAVPIGLMALSELYRRRPGTKFALFGTREAVDTAFPYEHLGVLGKEQLSWLYSEATVGLCLSLTNFSLMPKEMLACGLPCVELAGISAESIFGEDGPLTLARLEPVAIADALARLLDDRELWERRSADGLAYVASHTWDRATDEVEAGLRHALRLREMDSSVLS